VADVRLAAIYLAGAILTLGVVISTNNWWEAFFGAVFMLCVLQGADAVDRIRRG